MGGGDLNLKKSWHPQTRANQEKLWLAQKAKVEEEKKLETLRKELDEQRQLEELQRLQRESKGPESIKLERMDWMNSGAASSTRAAIQEDYLLGKRKVTDALPESELKPVHDPKKPEKTLAPLPKRDLEDKIRQDPLSIIKKRELQLARKKQDPIATKRSELVATIRSLSKDPPHEAKRPKR
jgi:hypothetical protein